jgi:GcrA cell cycle regulator
MDSGSWTPERVEQLRALWAKGYSNAAISVELGVSRNTIIGKVKRLKLVPRTPTKTAEGMGVKYPKPRDPKAEANRAAPKLRGKEAAKRTQADYQEMLAQAVRNTLDKAKPPKISP